MAPSRPPSAWKFRAIMLGSLLRVVPSALNPKRRAVDLHDPAEVEKVTAAYEGLDAAPAGTQHDIPKTVWMLWQQGWDTAPDLVKACAESWKRENPGWEVKLLDLESLDDYAVGYTETVRHTLTRQARANMARTMLLKQHGGVWADATLFCARPLDEWLPFAAPTGFFVFSDPRPYRSLDNWFIVGARDNYFIAAMLELFQGYWQRFEKPHRYFWMIYLMDYLRRRDPKAKRIWEGMGKLSALGPLAVQRHAFDPNPPAAIMRLIAEKKVPVYKFNHRKSCDDLTGTPLGAITGLKSVRGSRG